MVRASIFFAAVMMPLGCVSLSGVSDLKEETGSMDAGSGEASLSDTSVDRSDDASAPTDADTRPDVRVTSDARAGAALELVTTCAAASVGSDLLSFSDKDFSASFWFSAAQNAPGPIRLPIVWKGGRAAGEPGWMIGLEQNALAFCVADANGGSCAKADAALVPGHLVHVAITSKVGMDEVPRTLTIYALDRTAGATKHTIVATGVAQNNWTAPPTFTVGGASSPCGGHVAGVIDDLRLWSRELKADQIDANPQSVTPCSDANLVASYAFDEGIGQATTDCVSSIHLSLSGAFTWVPSPFP